jgi:hypothetical protein
MKPSPFLPMLREAVKHSASGDDLRKGSITRATASI